MQWILFPPHGVSRVLGHFEERALVELCNDMEKIELEEGQVLGQAGDGINVVQDGRLELLIPENIAVTDLNFSN